jgi:imidazolonepropionase-like amidohydrolase
MKKLTLLFTTAICFQLGNSQTLPFEFEAQRKPSYSTHGNLLIRNGRILTVTKGIIEDGDVLVEHGKIKQVGKALVAPSGYKVIDATGKVVTPGLVDAHSHRGEGESNEAGEAITAEVRIEDVLTPDYVGVYRGLASGITTGMLLHGSANPIGGQSIVVKHKFMHPWSEMIFPGAPRMIKFALGENPKRVGNENPSGPGRFPLSRMGVAQTYARAFADAQQYIQDWDQYKKHSGNPKIAPPRTDLRLETLADILRGKIRVQCHSYRQDEILMMVKLSQDFHFNLTLQHALEAYKVAPQLREARIPVSIFSDGFAYKLEVVDSMPMAATILDNAGVLVSINTDTFDGIAPLNSDAGRTVRYGTSSDHALRMITINPAIELGIDAKVGSLEPGKDGDIAIWSGDPLSNYSKCLTTFIEGEPYFERHDAFAVDSKSISVPTLAAKPFKADPYAPLKASKHYWIRDATVHPVSGPAIEHGSVVISDGKIAYVGTSPKLPPGTVTIDGRNLHVWPGFIDAGSQLGLTEFGEVNMATDASERGDWQPDILATVALNAESRHFPKVRYNGITTAVISPSGGLIAGQSGIVSTDLPFASAPSTQNQIGLEVNVPEGLDAATRETMDPEALKKALSTIRDQRRSLREYFQGAKRYLEAKKANSPLPLDNKMEAMLPYLEGLKPVRFNVNGEEACRWILGFAADFNLQAQIVGGTDAWKLAKLLKDRNVPVILTPPANACPGSDQPGSPFDPYDTPLASASVLTAAGVKVSFATHSFDSGMDLPYQVGRLCGFGLSHGAAIHSLTLDAAKTLGIDKETGSLEVGKWADIQITDGDPLDITNHVRYEFIRGRPQVLESIYTELYRKYAGR